MNLDVEDGIALMEHTGMNEWFSWRIPKDKETYMITVETCILTNLAHNLELTKIVNTSSSQKVTFRNDIVHFMD